MADEIELIGDGDDLAVIGNSKAVERFLKQADLLESSTSIPSAKLKTVLALAGAGGRAAADISEKSGRYLKLTAKSAADLKAAGGPMKSKDGTRYAMLGDPGKIAKWLEIEGGPAAVLTNPAVLGGIGGLMTQLSQQAEANELQALIERIDEKLDDVRRAQRDGVLAKMDSAAEAIEEAMTIHDAGGDPNTLWAKVQSESAAILEVQASALRELGALADKVDGKHKPAELRKITAQVERDVALWLAVLARCFELLDKFSVIEIDHVFDTAPNRLEGHRRGVAEASQKRSARVLKRTTKLMERMDAAGAIANENVLLHARAAHAVVDSLNSTATLVDDFHAPLGIEMTREPVARIRRREALHDPQQLKTAGLEAGKKAAGGGITAAAFAAGVLAFKETVQTTERLR